MPGIDDQVINLPTKMRQSPENIILLGTVPGPTAPPDLDVFLGPIVTELLQLWDKAAVIFDASDNQLHDMRVSCLCCVADTPGN